MEEKLTDQELARRAKLPKYKELGVDPFGQKYDWKNQIRDIRKEYGEVEAEDLSSKEVHVDIAGRIMAIRDMGKMNLAPSKVGLVRTSLEKITTKSLNLKTLVIFAVCKEH